ncbi:GNAT family N-acetyltransferase [Methylobacterium nonmethylotrophicum]|nr:GNAT family N-acetyltransferase [Methylobacterium nonmethylotrophicum]
MPLHIGAYEGDGSDLADLIGRSWRTAYAGKAWFPLWDRDYVAWRMMDPRILDRELMACAYDGDALIGCLIGEEARFAIRGRSVPGSLTSYLSIAPETRHRGLALRLLDHQKRLHRERGLALSLGVTSTRPGSLAKRFWDSAAARRPEDVAFLRPLRMWSAVVDPPGVAAAGLDRLERLAPWLAAPLAAAARAWPRPPARPFAAADLPACAAWTEGRMQGAACRMAWSPARLSLQLDHPASHTLVFEEGGRATGFVAAYLIDWLGAAPVRVGFIELEGGEGGTAAAARRLAAASRDLAARGAQMNVVIDGGTAPGAALLAAGFAPVDPHLVTVTLFPDPSLRLDARMPIHTAFT